MITILSNLTMRVQASSAAYVSPLLEPIDYVAAFAVSRGAAKSSQTLGTTTKLSCTVKPEADERSSH